MLVSALLLILGTISLAGTQGNTASTAVLPSLAELKEGWNTLEPGGATTCAVTKDFRFWARRARSDRLLVYLHGGGACWTGKDCDPAGKPTYVHSITPARDPVRLDGILNLTRPDNPVASYSMVVVPSCTGDNYLGDRDATYTIEAPDGGSRQLTIRHRGQTNMAAVLDWIHRNFDAPREIFVAGSSAGAVAAAFYANRLARHYSKAGVVALGDDSVGGGAQAVARTTWGLPDVLRRHAGWESADGKGGVVGLYINSGRGMSNLRLFQFDHAYDWARRFYGELGGTATEFSALPGLLRQNRQNIRASLKDFRSFTAGGIEHTILVQRLFYSYHTNGRRLRDWVAAIAAGQPVEDVDCTDCRRPGLLYSSTDLRIAEGALALLAGPEVWERRDDGTPCTETGTRHSLRCALGRATMAATGSRPQGDEPVLEDIRYEIAERMKLERFEGRQVVVYNNRPEATFDDVRSLLQSTSDRIRTSLAKTP